MASPWRARLVGGGLLALTALAMFDVPSAYAVARGAPWWLALAVGLMVFPILPVTWHVLRERGRPAQVKPGATTRSERFTFRTLVVGVLVIGALFALDRPRAWSGIRHHALWMIPRAEPRVAPDSKLLDRVPSSAEVVVWLRDTDDAHAMLAHVKPTSSGSRELVIAFAGKDVMVLERGDAGLIELVQTLSARIAQRSVGKTVELPGGIRMWATGGWGMSTGRPTAVLDLMRRAPDRAFLVAAGKPAMRDDVSSAVAWVTGDRGALEAVTELTTTSPTAALAMQAEAERALAKERMARPGDFVCASASDAALTISTAGNVVRIRGTIAIDQIRPLFECLD